MKETKITINSNNAIQVNGVNQGILYGRDNHVVLVGLMKDWDTPTIDISFRTYQDLVAYFKGE
jgi:hypothetical protein